MCRDNILKINEHLLTRYFRTTNFYTEIGPPYEIWNRIKDQK